MGFHRIIMTPPPIEPNHGVYMIPEGNTVIIAYGVETIVTGLVVSGELIVDGRITII